MDWTRAIEINREALLRIIAGIIALLKLEADGLAQRVPLVVYRLASRVLVPAESAVRRLIVVAARGVVLPPLPIRPVPQGLAHLRNRTRTSKSRLVFPLFDTRLSFPSLEDYDEDQDPKGGPRIRVVDAADPFSPLSLANQAKHPPADADGFVSADAASRIGRRYMAVKLALDDLSGQAKRLLRMQARKSRSKTPTFITPMRPGPPPGRRKRSRDEIDLVLKECHALARLAVETDIAPNTS